MNPSWQTPEDLATELGRPTRWVKERMASGEIPSVKLGAFRYFTPECRARLFADQNVQQAEPQGWALATRGKKSV